MPKRKTCPICDLPYDRDNSHQECQREIESYRETQASFIRDNSKGKT